MNNKKIIVVIGTGRSGTSLLMQILDAIGVEHAKEVVGPKRSNPKGPLESKQITTLQRAFLEKLGQGINNPIITGDILRSDMAKKLKCQIESHILEELKNSKTKFYAVKDPRITTLLPIWQEIFVENNIDPIYLFAARQPSSIIKSLVTHYDDTLEDAEILWLQRTISSFYHTKSKLFIIHYEEWFKNPRKQLGKLIGYLQYKNVVNIDEIIESVISQKLNKMQTNDITKNKKINDIYDKIKSIYGAQFSINDVYYFFEEQWHDMISFTSNFVSVLENNQKKIQQQESEISDQLIIIEQKNQQATQLKLSKTFQLGNLFFCSIKNPYKALMFPINFVKILFNKHY